MAVHSRNSLQPSSGGFRGTGFPPPPRSVRTWLVLTSEGTTSHPEQATHTGHPTRNSSDWRFSTRTAALILLVVPAIVIGLVMCAALILASKRLME